MVVRACFLKCKHQRYGRIKAGCQNEWPQRELSIFAKERSLYSLVSCEEPVGVQTDQLIILKRLPHSIDMRQIRLNKNNVEVATSGHAFQVVFDLLLLSIKHDYIDTRL